MSKDPVPGISDGVRAKAHAYLTDGRVQVVEASQDPLTALVLVSGSGDEPYRILVKGREVLCSCPARVWGCAHVVASLLVLEVPDAHEPTSLGEGGIDTLVELSDEEPDRSQEDLALTSEIEELLGLGG